MRSRFLDFIWRNNIINFMIEKKFDELSVQEVEEKLARDLAVHNKFVRKRTIIILIVLLFVFRGAIAFWLRFGFIMPSSYDKTPIITQNEPVQINYSADEKRAKTFKMKSLINDNEVTVIPQAYYKISGLVMAMNHDFIFVSDFFDSAALYDIGIAWGQLANKKVYKSAKVKCYSAKTELTGSRILRCKAKNNAVFRSKNDDNVFQQLYSHSHLVPANDRVMGGLLKIRRMQIVELEGELIDMEQDSKRGVHREYRTSMSRTDGFPHGDRGHGNCETMYVKKVKIGNRVYK